MLKHSFCCFHGVTEAAERKFWRAGCLEWTALPYCSGAVSPKKLQMLIAQMPEMEGALAGRLAGYFLSRLPPGHRLRVWPALHEGTVFVDVETTGLSCRDEITVIGAWQAGRFNQYVKGLNLADFLALAGRAQLLITFNGIRFDWPAIERTFRFSLPLPHVDLMHEARAHGYAGGLKAIERSIGVHRLEAEMGDGAMAVTLWRQYEETGDRAVLERLLRYNEADVRSLVALSRRLLRRSTENYPGPRLELPPCRWHSPALAL